MILNDVVTLENNYNLIPNNKSILNFGLKLKDTKIFTLKGTNFSEEISVLDKKLVCEEIEESNLVILSEPFATDIEEFELKKFIDRYKEMVEKANSLNIPIVHIVTNNTWFMLFKEIIDSNDVPVYLRNKDYTYLKNNIGEIEFHIVEDFFLLKDFHHYSNEITDNILVDLTAFQKVDNFYTQTINSLFDIVPNFKNVTILLSDDSHMPNIDNEKITVSYQSDGVNIDSYTYVLLLNNTPYSDESIYKAMYYAANSKVLFTNYNFKLNNMIPSVILNLSSHLDIVMPLSKSDAFDIMNENRNTVLYKFTSINLIERIYNNIFDMKLIEPLFLDNSLKNFEGNLFIFRDKTSNAKTHLNDFKYDLEQTLAFPIIFLGEKNVAFKDSSILTNKVCNEKFVIKHANRDIAVPNLDEKVSVIVPIHNNGKYLKYKCFRSLKSLSRFNEMEIIFIDDGSTDFETLRIIDDIISSNDGIVFKRYENGSGSASRPRNEGVYLASTNLITYLDPDNETIDDGHSTLLTEMLNDESLDMVVGNIVREDNNKRNAIKYSTKVQNAIKSDIIEDTKETLIKTNLTVQSIQGLIVKKNIIINNDIIMVEGAAGQDTLYFQELILNCENVKVVDHMIHSYYAYVEGSVTNTVTHRFFEKFYKVEQERIKFLVKEDLIDHYMKIKFNFYFKKWYFTKFLQVDDYDKEKSLSFLKKIVSLYHDYEDFIDEDIKEFLS
ncbi:glycosyltransferase [Jeotgalicoccus huakuii]|nr:glycosyltransferase [Jeotgalicoccus huakuii]